MSTWDPPGQDPYAHPRLYDLEYADHDEDVAFYVGIAMGSPSSVLELGVGTGRLTLRMAAAGATVWGIERSEAMLEQLNRRRCGESAEVQSRVDVRLGDYRSFSLQRQFDAVLLPFNALHHCETLEDIDALLSCVVAHLSAKGAFTLDCYLPDWALYGRSAGRYEHRLFTDPDTGESWRSWEESYWDEALWIHHVWYLYARGREAPTCCELKLHMYSEATLRQAMRRAGLVIVSEAAGFQGEPFDDGGTRWVVTLRLATE